MTLSLPALQAALAQQTAEVFLACLVISHADLPDDVRIVNNNENLTRGSDVYVAFPFEAQLPDDQADQLPQLTLRIDNVSREIMQAIRALASPPTVTLDVVLASSPTTVEAGPYELSIKEISYDVASIVVTLGYEDMLNEPFPQHTFSPKNFPGIF